MKRAISLATVMRMSPEQLELAGLYCRCKLCRAERFAAAWMAQVIERAGIETSKCGMETNRSSRDGNLD